MEERLRRLMKHEGINSTRLAEILGIQASGISHIMSGRNKPSFDFLLKLLQRFPQISPDWLILDKGPMYRDEIKKNAVTTTTLPTIPVVQLNQQTTSTDGLFAASSSPMTTGQPTNSSTTNTISSDTVGSHNAAALVSDAARVSAFASRGYAPDNDDLIPAAETTAQSQAPAQTQNSTQNPASQKIVDRIVVFYRDKTFADYRPA